MSTPTATPRTDAALYPMNGVEIVWPYFARQLETELAASKAECERLKNQRDNLLKPLRARAEDRADAAEENVERLTSENEKLTIERDALANGSAIEIAHLRADLAVAENWVEHHSQHADDLIGENVKLRADLQRFTGHGLLDCHAICDQRDAAVAERDRLRAELKELSQAYELNRVSIDELDADRARAERAELKLEKMATALADCISTFRSDDKTTIITAERQEAWRAALLSYKPDHTFT